MGQQPSGSFADELVRRTQTTLKSRDAMRCRQEEEVRSEQSRLRCDQREWADRFFLATLADLLRSAASAGMREMAIGVLHTSPADITRSWEDWKDGVMKSDLHGRTAALKERLQEEGLVLEVAAWSLHRSDLIRERTPDLRAVEAFLGEPYETPPQDSCYLIVRW